MKHMLLLMMLCFAVLTGAGCSADPISADPGDDANQPGEPGDPLPVGTPYLFPFAREGTRITLTDQVGRETTLEGEALAAAVALLEEARYEADEMPDRETGGGIQGYLLVEHGEEELIIALHADFIWVDNLTFFLAAEKVAALLALFN